METFFGNFQVSVTSITTVLPVMKMSLGDIPSNNKLMAVSSDRYEKKVGAYICCHPIYLFRHFYHMSGARLPHVPLQCVIWLLARAPAKTALVSPCTRTISWLF
jgi:hypothetical protein